MNETSASSPAAAPATGNGHAAVGATGSENAIAEMSFEAALEELGGLVRRLEAGQVPLDDAVTLYERATALKAHCDARLRNAEARIERIRLSSDGTPTGLTPFDDPASAPATAATGAGFDARSDTK